MAPNKRIQELLDKFPKIRKPLPPEYKKAFGEYYMRNRLAHTSMSKASSIMEGWMHKKIASTERFNQTNGTLEIGAGTLNQLKYEKIKVRYDIVEPNYSWVDISEYKERIGIRYDDISEIPFNEKYDRITSCAVFEHILDLPQVIAKAGIILSEGGVLSVGIPNEGKWLWHIGWKYTTGREFKKIYGLDYGLCQKYEHVNTADEIETLLNYFFEYVKVSRFGIGKFAFYLYLECTKPVVKRCEEALKYVAIKKASPEWEMMKSNG